MWEGVEQEGDDDGGRGGVVLFRAIPYLPPSAIPIPFDCDSARGGKKKDPVAFAEQSPGNDVVLMYSRASP